MTNDIHTEKNTHEKDSIYAAEKQQGRHKERENVDLANNERLFRTDGNTDTEMAKKKRERTKRKCNNVSRSDNNKAEKSHFFCSPSRKTNIDIGIDLQLVWMNYIANMIHSWKRKGFLYVAKKKHTHTHISVTNYMNFIESHDTTKIIINFLEWSRPTDEQK